MFMLLVKYGCEHRCSGFHAMDDDGNKGLCPRKARGDSFNEQNYLCFHEYWFKLTVCSGLD